MDTIYKKTLLIFSLLLCTFLNAQIEKPKTPSNTTPAKPKPATQAKINPATVLTLKVKCNLDAEVFVDDESRGQATAATIKKVFLGKGEFQLKFVSTANSADVYVITYVVTSQDINSEKILDVDLILVRDKRIALEQKNACSKCHGKGSHTTQEDCKRCEGGGKVQTSCTYSLCRNGRYVSECSRCNGTGKESDFFTEYICRGCDGTGHQKCIYCGGDGLVPSICPSCNGTRKIEVTKSCPH